ncbi:MAG: glycosyltransferase family 2 protein [Bacteroidales bacterium]|jgi:glycosyltransferase involved in cell wall biosynthesis|nr:glycosyltransferase family 2 protein [Bacteroidales bacterium]
MKFEDIHNKMLDYKVCIVIPAYNSEKTIEHVINSVSEYTLDLIVVNDGSTDSTLNILEKFYDKINLVSYKINRGKGYALKQAFDKAMGLGYDYALTLDSDGQHLAEDIPVFLNALAENENSLLIGSRSFDHPNMPQGNIFANKFSNFWFTLQTAKKLPDTQTGYRLYPLRRMKKMRPFTKRYESELELLVRMAWKGIRIVPVSINVHYPAAGERVTHFRPRMDFIRISLLNTLFCFLAVLYGYPSIFIHKVFANNQK